MYFCISRECVKPVFGKIPLNICLHIRFKTGQTKSETFLCIIHANCISMRPEQAANMSHSLAPSTIC